MVQHPSAIISYSLDHLPLTLLGFSSVVLKELSYHGIDAVEMLAVIGLIPDIERRQSLLKLIHQDLSTRLWPIAIECAIKFKDDPCQIPTLCICTEYFLFSAAVVSVNPLFCNSEYRWIDRTLEGSLPFHLKIESATDKTTTNSTVWAGISSHANTPQEEDISADHPQNNLKAMGLISQIPQIYNFPAAITELPITQTALSTRIQNALIRYNIRTIGELASRSDGEILDIKHFGPKMLAEVRDFLASLQFEQSVIEGMDDSPLITRFPELQKSISRIETMPLHLLKLPPRPINSLMRAGVFSLGQVLAMRRRDLAQLPNFGPKSLALVEAELQTLRVDIVLEQLAVMHRQAKQPQALLIASMEQITPELRRKLASFGIVHVKHLFEHTLEHLAQNGLSHTEVRALVAVLEPYGLAFRGQINAPILEGNALPDSPVVAIRENRDLGSRQDTEIQPFFIDTLVQQFLSVLDPRQEEVLRLRYGLNNSPGKTLQAVADIIGGVSRERVRQIENKAVKKLRSPQSERIFNPIRNVLEDALLQENGVTSIEKARQVLAHYTQDLEISDSILEFLLIFIPTITRFKELKIISLNHPPFSEYLASTEYICGTLSRVLTQALSPLPLENLLSRFLSDSNMTNTANQVPVNYVVACLKAHPDIVIDDNGCCNLRQWTNRRFDDIIVVMRQEGAPLHYSEIADRVNQRLPEEMRTSAHNIHAQLGRLSQIFVRVGHGIFGLAEWGLRQDRNLSDAAHRLLSEVGHALDIEELTDRVLETWQVKRGSVRAAVELDERFLEVSPGRYWLASPNGELSEVSSANDFHTLFGEILMRRHQELEIERKREDNFDNLEEVRRLGTNLFS